MKTPDLKPCPFCGGEAKLSMTTDAGNYAVHCTKCPADVGRMWYYKKQGAVRAWNRRVSDENGR